MQDERFQQPTELLTARQAAQRLGLRESTIRAWIAQRRLAFIRLGRSVRISSAEVEKLIARGTVPVRTGGRN